MYDAIENESVQSVKDPNAGFCIWRCNRKLGLTDMDEWEQILKVRAADEASQKGGHLRGCRIRRNALQGVLVEGVESCGLVVEWKWGTKAIAVRPQLLTGTEVVESGSGQGLANTPGTMQVQLASGESLRADVVIAADGASSAIRQQHKALEGGGRLDYAGVAIIAGVSRFASHEDVPQRVRACWGLVTSGTGVGLFVSPVDDTSALWSLSFYAKERVEDRRWPMSKEVVVGLMKRVKELAMSFDAMVQELVERTDPETLMQLSAMDRPAFYHDVHRDGNVVYLGDANHAVSPFAGNGANLALNDGWDFAESVVGSTGLEDAVKRYDQKAVPRAKQTLRMSRWFIDVGHSTGWKLWGYLFIMKAVDWLLLKKSREPHGKGSA